jgi:ATP-binding cassette subfamily F protein uup
MDHVNQAKKAQAVKVVKQEKPTTKTPVQPVAKKKLSFKEQQELDKLPEQIAELEVQQTELNKKISAPDFYKKDQMTVSKTLDDLKIIDAKLEKVYQRWDELEALTEANS